MNLKQKKLYETFLKLGLNQEEITETFLKYQKEWLPDIEEVELKILNYLKEKGQSLEDKIILDLSNEIYPIGNFQKIGFYI